MNGRHYRAIVDTVLKASVAGGVHPYVELLYVMQAACLEDFDRSILLMNLYYRRDEFSWHVPKFIIP